MRFYAGQLKKVRPDKDKKLDIVRKNDYIFEMFIWPGG